MAVFTIGELGLPSRTLGLRKRPGEKTLAQARATQPGASSRAVAAATAPRLQSSSTGLPGALAPSRPSPSPATSLAQARPTLTATAVAPVLHRKRPASSPPATAEEAGAEMAAGAAAVAEGWDGYGVGDDGEGFTDDELAAGWVGPRRASSSPDVPKDGIPSWAAFAGIGVVLIAGVWAFNAGKFG